MTGALIIGSMTACTQQTEETFIGRQQPDIENRTFTPEALWAMGRIGNYNIAPDGQSIVYNVSYYSVELNKSHTVIYTSDTRCSEGEV